MKSNAAKKRKRNIRKMNSIQVSLNSDVIELGFESSDQIDTFDTVGGIILPFGAGGVDAIQKTVVATVKQIRESASKKLGIRAGDEILVDRYAIIQVKKGLTEFNSFIKTDSVIMTKKKCTEVKGRPAKVRILDYLEIAPKKCFFSCYNTFCREECTLVAMKYVPMIKAICKMWEERENHDESFEDFRKRVMETEM